MSSRLPFNGKRVGKMAGTRCVESGPKPSERVRIRVQDQGKDNAQQASESVADVLLSNLVRRGKLSPQQVLRAIEWQRQRGVNSREAVEQMRLVNREDMLKALSQRYSYPILDDVPENKRFSRELVMGHEPFSAAAEAIRSIRSAVASAAMAQGTRSIVILAPDIKTGVTYLASNLAVGFAQMAIPTLLVDANLRSPRVADIFGVPPQAEGLTEYLRHLGSGLAPIISDIIPNLSILPAGSIPPNPQELLSSPEFLALTETCHERFGVVLYDTSATSTFSDALVICSRINAAIMVARRNQTLYNSVTKLADELKSIRCNLLGTVFNQF